LHQLANHSAFRRSVPEIISSRVCTLPALLTGQIWDSSLGRRVICPKSIGILLGLGLRLGLGLWLWLGFASNFGICASPFRTNNLSDKWPVTEHTRPAVWVTGQSCPLTFWPSKWCPSHMWRGLPLCQFYSSWASLFLT